MTVVSLSHIWREELRPLLDAGIEYVAVDPDDEAAAVAAARDAEVLITTKFDEAMSKRTPKLKLLLCPSAGTEGIDRTHLPPGVDVFNGRGHEIPMAEYVVGVLIALRQRLVQADRALRDGRWECGFLGSGGFVSEVWDSKLGLVGFGRIGKEIAPRAAAFGIATAALTMHPERVKMPAAGLNRIGDLKSAQDVDEIFRASDAVVLCCELSDRTRGLVDSRRLRLMQPHALLINVSRGPIADEQALYEALRDRVIAGAALDVWYDYPKERGARTFPSRFPFSELDNVIMTPHCSGWTEGHRRRKLAAMAEAINGYASSGHPFRNR
ncbi:MAG TPA: NAD(P)-dependent oxidoreductase [Candidatus Eremiobacteraceae bacterium]|nr:NAD(P)-dependent oxidoreductase [Candidatus Eremiobacteraceae bacterium]